LRVSRADAEPEQHRRKHQRFSDNAHEPLLPL
jgi:hypothetical protein